MPQDPDNSSQTVSTGRSQDSGSDSLNSLIGDRTTDSGESKDNVECSNSCVVECSLANQCAACDNGSDGFKPRKSICCSSVGQCVWGVVLMLMSISGLVVTPLDLMLKEKLNMRPGMPPFQWWSDPPDELKLRMYVFNVTNHERFLAGLDQKLNMDEIGPIVYLEKLLHYNISFNDNSTMTYTAKRYPIYLPKENLVDLNATLIVPNMAVLGFASYLHNANYFVRSGFRFLVNSHHSQFFVKKTVYEYLWDYREPVLDTSKNFMPGLVPVNNMGVMSVIYSNFTDVVTVKIGQQWGHSGFFEIDRFKGEPQLPGFDPDKCPDRIFGSTEGVMYHQLLKKQDVLLYWRKTVCKLMPLHFESELVLDSVPVYRYNLSESVYERIVNGTDCYDTEPTLPVGVSDGSKCYFGFPMVITYPHFYTGEPPKDHFVTGLQPDRYKHNSYIVVEPMTGTPFRSVARMQSNLRIHDLSGFTSEYDRFSNLILPMFWAEYNQEGLPSYIRWTIYFMIVILPPLSTALFGTTIFVGCLLITRQIYINKLRNDSLDSFLYIKRKNVNKLAKNKIFSYEKEAFLKVPS